MTSMFHLLLLSLLVLGNSMNLIRCHSIDRRELLMATMYEQWMAQNGRMYSSMEEKEYRYKVFKENAKFIESFNANASRKYTLSINKFADMTNEEFQAYWTGYIPSQNIMVTQTVAPFRYANVTVVPESLDWRTLGAVTPVKSQGSCGSCCPFAAVAAIESLTYIKKCTKLDLSEQEILSCDHKNDAAGCLGSNLPGTYEFVLRNGGLTTESNFPYTGTNGTCNVTKETSPAARISGYELVPVNDEKSLLKAVANQPVTVALDCSGFAKTFQFYSGGVFTGSCGTELNHAVTVVGYGETDDGVKYWILKNSWGADWGENGYMRIQRDVEAKEGMCGLAMDASYPVF